MSRRSCGLRDSEISGSSNTIWFTSTSMSDLRMYLHREHRVVCHFLLTSELYCVLCRQVQ
jgi:hypothetical protein